MRGKEVEGKLKKTLNIFLHFFGTRKKISTFANPKRGGFRNREAAIEK
jgi:hypothetical protein